jgi:hypothetical protein
MKARDREALLTIAEKRYQSFPRWMKHHERVAALRKRRKHEARAARAAELSMRGA